MSEKKRSTSNRPETLHRHRGIKTGSRGKTIRRIRVSYLRPSFWEGVARLLDIGGTMGARVEVGYERNSAGKTEAELNAEEIRSIWAEVGDCMYEAMGRHPESELNDSEPTKGEK